MGVHISDEILQKTQLSSKEMLIEIATHLYDLGKLTMGQARKLAELDQISFQKELSKRNIYIKYDVEDLMEDLKTLEELKKLKP